MNRIQQCHSQFSHDRTRPRRELRAPARALVTNVNGSLIVVGDLVEEVIIEADGIGATHC